MPTMPFHLEKGDLLNALESLVNAESPPGGPANPLVQVLQDVCDDLAGGTNLKAALDSVIPAGSSGGSVAGRTRDALEKWFDPPPGGNATNGYWVDYDNSRTDEVVTQAIRFAMRTAWGWQNGPVPAGRRPIRFWWWCEQPWFDSWVTWESGTSAVNVFFATPPHTGGKIVRNMHNVPATDAAPIALTGTGDASGDMVLVSTFRHKRRKVATTAATPQSDVAVPKRVWEDKGKLGMWSIQAKAGGMNPRMVW